MRITLLAVAMALFGSVLPLSAQAVIQHYQLNIPKQSLDTALKDFAHQTGLQVARMSDAVDGSAVVGPVSGKLSAEEALKSLLTPQKLSYKMVNERTIAIVKSGVETDSVSPLSTSAEKGEAPVKEDGKKTSQDFRVAQVDQGKNASASSVGQQGLTSQDNSRSPSTGLEEIVVTAQKREERLKDVPISIAVLSGKDLEESTYSGVTDALNTVPGVATLKASQTGTTQITIRGVTASGATAAGAGTAAYYLDSIPFGFVKSAIAPDPDVYDLQRIEVLRGPQGTLYGANAENGVVRVLTNDPDLNAFDFKARTLLSTTDGGGENYGGAMAVNIPVVEGRVAVRGVVDYQDLSGWIDGPLGEHLNDSELHSYRFKINALPTDELSVGLSVWSVRDDYGAPSSSNAQRTVTAEIPEPSTQDYDAYALKLGYESQYFSVSSATSYVDYADTSVVDFGKYGVGFPLKTTLDVNYDSKVFSEELVLNSSANSSWHWTAGGFYRHGTDQLYSALPTIGVPGADFSDESKSYALFGQLGRRFLEDQLEWTLGLRYFHDDVSTENVQVPGSPAVLTDRQTASFNATTPRVVLSWYPSTNITVYSSYSQGFRSGFPQDPGVTLPALKPDKLNNYEIGAKADLWDNRVSLESAIYYIKWNDIQQLLVVPYGPNGIPVSGFVNAQSASGPGIDFAVAARPLEGLEFAVTAGWNDLKMDADTLSEGVVLFSRGDRLNYSPEFTGGLSAGYTFPVADAFRGHFSVSGNYTSHMIDHIITDGASVDNTGNSLVDVRTAFSITAPSHWSATLFVDNLTNNYGAIPPLGFPVEQLSPRPRPRTMGIQLDYKY